MSDIRQPIPTPGPIVAAGEAPEPTGEPWVPSDEEFAAGAQAVLRRQTDQLRRSGRRRGEPS